MKKWSETRQVLDRLAGLRSEGRAAAIAMVVRVRGSAYRHEGARMLVADDGSTVGNVSGGCLEADVREVAMRVLATGKPESREYCGSADEVEAWDVGVGCEGVVNIDVSPCTLSDAALAELRALLEGDSPFEWHWTLADGGVFVDEFAPPPKLLILGAGDDARPLARFAHEVGFRVTVVDRRPALLRPDRFADGVRLIDAVPDTLASRVTIDESTYAVAMNHRYADDREFLRVLLESRAAYIGMLGPRQRTDRMLAELVAEDDARVHGPVGLDIGTDGAEQVAMSVIAEMLAVRSGRRPMSLRERRAPIHAAAGPE